MDAVKFNNVTKKFQMVIPSENFKNLMFKKKVIVNTVIDNITFNIPSGQCIGIIGRNGSGKSTLLSLIAKILDPDSGEIQINGKVASILELGMGFHQDLSGRENIYIKCEMYGFTKKEVNEIIDDIIDYSGLGDYIELPIRTYSSGMVGRLAFAILVNVNADIMILDEILSVGDAYFSLKASEYFKKCIRSNKTVIIVSHSTKTIESLCTRAIWIEKGKIIADGDPTTVCSKYEYEMQNSLEVIAELSKLGVPSYQYKYAKYLLAQNEMKYSDEIVSLLKSSAESGNLKAQLDYADYLHSIQDPLAITYYELVANSGNAEARKKLSAIYSDTEYENNRNELLMILRNFAKNGHPRDIYRYGVVLYNNAWGNDDIIQSFKIFKEAADLGYVEANYQVALMYLDGVGADKDSTQAVHYFKKAANNGHLLSQIKLADCYMTGINLEKNESEAFKWYHQAAIRGNRNSQYQIATMLKEGKGVSRDIDKSRKWYSIYACANLAPYQMMVAEMMKNSTRDYENMPLLMYEKATKSYNHDAIVQLAIMYRDGISTFPDITKSKEYFERACMMSNGPFNALADFFFKGIATSIDIDKAIELYEKSAMNGDSAALLKLAKLYKQKNESSKSQSYLNLAANRGNREALIIKYGAQQNISN